MIYQVVIYQKVASSLSLNNTQLISRMILVDHFESSTMQTIGKIESKVHKISSKQSKNMITKLHLKILGKFQPL